MADRTVELLRKLADAIESDNHVVSDINYTITKIRSNRNSSYYLEIKNEPLEHEIRIQTIGKAL